MTKARKALLDVLIHSRMPVCAADLVGHPDLPFDQATIYRNLHYLEDQGYADSFVLHCSDHGTERYYSYRRGSDGSHHHWFHCENCHKFIDLGGCGYANQLRHWESEYGFSIHDHTFFVTGICKECSKRITSAG